MQDRSPPPPRRGGGSRGDNCPPEIIRFKGPVMLTVCEVTVTEISNIEIGDIGQQGVL